MRGLKSRGWVVGVAAVVGLAGVVQLAAQLVLPKDGETMPTFEVATIRTSPEGGRMMRIQWQEDTYRTDNVALRSVIRTAYNATSDAQIIGGPDALLGTHFDINAKADATVAAAMRKMSRDDSERERELMLQSLLAERFHLKVHTETREQPVYALVVAKGGPKLKASAPEPATPPDQPPPGPPPPGGPGRAPGVPRGMWTIRMSGTKVEMNGTDVTMDVLATMLTNQPDAGGRVVVDKTGLTGKYDLNLSWTPTVGMVMRGMDDGTKAAGADPDEPGLFTAVEEQLGLKLEAQKGAVQVVVIDHVEAPSAN